MGAVSLSEDALDRFISDVSQISSDLDISNADLALSEAKIRTCRLACDQIVESLRRAKEIASDPSLAKSQRIDWLQIENHRLFQSIARLEKTTLRLQNKIAEIRSEKEKLIEIQTKRTLAAEKENQDLRGQLKTKKDEIKELVAGKKAKAQREKKTRQLFASKRRKPRAS